MTPLPDPPPAHEEIARLTREVAALRAQLAARTDVVSPSPSPAGVQPTRPPAPSRARRWIGRTIGAALLAAGFGLGVWYATEARDELVRGYRDGRANREAARVPVPPPSPAPPAAGTPSP
jgi:anti-sigma factor RsiW